MKNQELKKITMFVITAILTLTTLIIIPKLWEDVDAGEVVIIQDPFDGDLHVYTEPGFVWQGMGRATHYRKSNQFWFSAPQNEGEPNLSIPVKWNDGGHASISGSVRYDLPMEKESLIKLHSIFGTQESIEAQLIKTNIEKAIYMTGPLMTSKESYAEKRNDLIFYIEDQASRGVYKTKQIEVKEVDGLTNEEKMVTKVEIVEKNPGQPIRQEESPIKSYGVRLYNISINGIEYDKTVERQIQTQQQAIMNVQTAIANAKKAEQDAITIAKQGEAEAAKAKWEQEVIKAKMVTQAEAQRKVAEEDVKTAELNKRRDILEGEGIAAKKKLVMQADGALQQKLDTYVTVQKYWADAFSKYGGNVVPQIQSGGGSSQNGATQFMEMMGAKAARDLSLDLKTK
jgi:regulator of protease activity HflC (stomatin/prohibitin superfamily)